MNLNGCQAFLTLSTRLRPRAGLELLDRAAAAARHAGIAALVNEIAATRSSLEKPAARIRSRGDERSATLFEVEQLLGSTHLVVDACRRQVSCRGHRVSLARRPVLFALARTLAESWPDAAERHELVARAFESRVVSDSLRARLRVEIGRLRRALRDLGSISAADAGFVLSTPEHEVTLLLPPVDGADAAIVALLGDGAAWSATSLALALDVSPRTVQRALSRLESEGRARRAGRGRSQRWLSPPITGYTTAMLLSNPRSLR